MKAAAGTLCWAVCVGMLFSLDARLGVAFLAGVLGVWFWVAWLADQGPSIEELRAEAKALLGKAKEDGQ